MQKTNALRLLDAAGIPYTTAEYEVDVQDLSGTHAAEMLGMPAERVFKTLVLQGSSGGHIVCCIPVAEMLDFKKAARASGEKSVEMIPVKALLPLTGYIRGGCSPIGMKKLFPTFIDESAELYDTIGICAGARGCQLFLPIRVLLDFIPAQSADLTVSG
jgi:Cys-tRNA(Pro)/Cys-tRNA(Cys) deacylase